MDLGACLLTLNEKTINQTILDGGGHALGITVGGGGLVPLGWEVLYGGHCSIDKRKCCRGITLD